MPNTRVPKEGGSTLESHIPVPPERTQVYWYIYLLAVCVCTHIAFDITARQTVL